MSLVFLYLINFKVCVTVHDGAMQSSLSFSTEEQQDVDKLFIRESLGNTTSIQ